MNSIDLFYYLYLKPAIVVYFFPHFLPIILTGWEQTTEQTKIAGFSLYSWFLACLTIWKIIEQDIKKILPVTECIDLVWYLNPAAVWYLFRHPSIGQWYSFVADDLGFFGFTCFLVLLLLSGDLENSISWSGWIPWFNITRLSFELEVDPKTYE